MNNVEFEDIRIKMPELRMWFGDREIYPSLTEMRLLLILLSDPCGGFATEELVTRMGLTGKQSLHTLIANLRRKLDQKYIFAVRGWGYTFARGRA